MAGVRGVVVDMEEIGGTEVGMAEEEVVEVSEAAEGGGESCECACYFSKALWERVYP